MAKRALSYPRTPTCLSQALTGIWTLYYNGWCCCSHDWLLAPGARMLEIALSLRISWHRSKEFLRTGQRKGRLFAVMLKYSISLSRRASRL